MSYRLNPRLSHQGPHPGTSMPNNNQLAQQQQNDSVAYLTPRRRLILKIGVVVLGLIFVGFWACDEDQTASELVAALLLLSIGVSFLVWAFLKLCDWAL